MRIETELVGREPELDRLDAFLDATTEASSERARRMGRPASGSRARRRGR